jgi:phage tail sheath protein FI
MPVQVSYPGVYVQEAPSGVHMIAQVATSVAAFVGMAPSGPVNVPTQVLSYREFDKIFGGQVDVGELPDQVRQFFLNGGNNAWIVRNAANAGDGSSMTASSNLFAEDNPATSVLEVSAKSAGSAGNALQVAVDYNTASPERTFNLSIFQPVIKSDGSVDVKLIEQLKDLSMDPDSPSFAPTTISLQSAFLNAAPDSTTFPGGVVTPASNVNLSQTGIIFSDLPTFVTTNLAGANPRLILVSVARKPPVPVDLQGLPTAAATPPATYAADIQTLINNALQNAGQVATVAVDAPAVATGVVLRISSVAGPVVVTSSNSNDAAAILQLGVSNGGLEFDGFSMRRPAATGFLTRASTGSGATLGSVLKRLYGFAGAAQNGLGAWTITGSGGKTATGSVASFTTAATMSDRVPPPPGVAGDFATVAASFQSIADSINADPGKNFKAYSTRTRIGISPLYGGADSDLSISLTSAGPGYVLDGASNIAQAAANPDNVVRNPIGLAPPGGSLYRTLVQAGNDGGIPLPSDYDYSWDKLERIADIFNILVLPRATAGGVKQSDLARSLIWPAASLFCERLRAFLIVDPPALEQSWKDVPTARAAIGAFRGPLEQDYAALYWPRVITSDPAGNVITIDPSGTIAGLYAKTDTKRGVWKAPAGLEASLVGVTGLEHYVTNDENGQTNPLAINTLRMKVSGITSWGARTLMGYDDAPDQDYRYVPVRRVALLIEESLYRGLQFAVFEPNAEPLWGQIRLAAGSFMNSLFKQGAFKGEKASDAYYVACGPSTTSQRDINLGQCNVEVGFAPLKPAEFVVLTIKQLAGQIDV